MDSKATLPVPGSKGYFNRRSMSRRSQAKTLRGEVDARFIQLKPGLFMKPNPSKKTFVASFKTGRQQSLQLNKARSEHKLPTLSASLQSKNTMQQNTSKLLPSMTHQSSRAKLGDPTLNRIYSNPQFQALNQAPYLRPKTSAFGYPNDRVKKDPTKKAPWTSEEVNSITGVKTMTSLAPGNAKLKKDKNESSPAKRSLSRRKNRKKTSHKTFREGLHEASGFESRPKTSYLLQSVAERMAWPKNPRGREPIDPMTPIKAYRMKDDHISPFRQSIKDVRSSLENLPEEAEFTISDFNKQGHADTLGHHKETLGDEGEDDLINKNTVTLGNQQIEDYLSGTGDDGEAKGVSAAAINQLNKKQANIIDIITILKNQPNDTGQYFYLIPRAPKIPHSEEETALRASHTGTFKTESEEGGPYDLVPILELEDHKRLEDYTQFYTLSKKGITTYVNDEPTEFITLKNWIHDKDNYNAIRKKTFFRNFDRWRLLRRWRTDINKAKRKKITEDLVDKLFILDENYREVIFKLRKRCTEVESLRFIHIQDNNSAIKIDDFAQEQDKTRENLTETLQKFSRDSREYFRDAIKKIIDKLKQANTSESSDNAVQKKFGGDDNDK